MVEAGSDARSWLRLAGGRTLGAMDRTTPPPGELVVTSALLSLYVGLRSSAWAVGRLERITTGRGATAR